MAESYLEQGFRRVLTVQNGHVPVIMGSRDAVTACSSQDSVVPLDPRRKCGACASQAWIACVHNHEQRDGQLGWAKLFQPLRCGSHLSFVSLGFTPHLALLWVGSVECEASENLELALKMAGMFEPIPVTQLCLEYSRNPKTCCTLFMVQPIIPRNSVAATSAQEPKIGSMPHP